jgi:hypothetical protein
MSWHRIFGIQKKEPPTTQQALLGCPMSPPSVGIAAQIPSSAAVPGSSLKALGQAYGTKLVQIEKEQEEQQQQQEQQQQVTLSQHGREEWAQMQLVIIGPGSVTYLLTHGPVHGPTITSGPLSF